MSREESGLRRGDGPSDKNLIGDNICLPEVARQVEEQIVVKLGVSILLLQTLTNCKSDIVDIIETSSGTFLGDIVLNDKFEKLGLSKNNLLVGVVWGKADGVIETTGSEVFCNIGWNRDFENLELEISVVLKLLVCSGNEQLLELPKQKKSWDMTSDIRTAHIDRIREKITKERSETTNGAWDRTNELFEVGIM